MSEHADLFVQELHIAARPEIVYRYFTEPDRMACWMGLEPVPGGEFCVDVTGRDLAVGRYVELVPPTRVVFTFGWQQDTEMPPDRPPSRWTSTPTVTGPTSASPTVACRRHATRFMPTGGTTTWTASGWPRAAEPPASTCGSRPGPRPPETAGGRRAAAPPRRRADAQICPEPARPVRLRSADDGATSW